MNFISEMIAVVEVIVINLWIFNKNAKARVPMSKVITRLLLFSVALIAIGVGVIKTMGVYGNGNGLFTLFGFFYLIPLHFLYEGSVLKHFFIICFAWIYTLSVFSVSVQIGYFFQGYGLTIVTAAAQTLLFVLTFRLTDRFMRKVYLPILNCEEHSIQKFLNQTSLIWFLTILILNLHFIFDQLRLLKILSVVTLILNVWMNYLLIYEILIRRKEIGTLEDQVAVDALTGLGSRSQFVRIMEEQIKTGRSFHLMFMDLDHFKQINDQYGHIAGDEYLKAFAFRLRTIAGQEPVFRISGDEFILLSYREDLSAIIQQMDSMEFELPSSAARFQGVSYGIADFPQDGEVLDQLVFQADQRMYAMKNQAHVQDCK